VRRLVAAAVVLGAIAAAVVLAGASDETGARRYQIEFDNAFGLVEGGDLKVGGVRAGSTSGFRLSKDRPPKAIVEVEVTKPGFGDFRTDATCEIRPQSLIGEYYVDCQPGSSPRRLPYGGTVPVDQTSSGIPADLVNNILRRPTRERLRLIVSELGAGLAGRPDELSEVIRRAHPGLRETDRVLRILGRQNRIIRDFISDADTVVAQLETRKTDVARFVVEAGETAETSATRQEALRGSFRRLPPFLDELRPTMARLGGLADEQVPLLADLQRAAPDLEELLARLGPFAEATRPALRSLGKASEVGTRALRKGAGEVEELRELANEAPPLARPARQLLESLDDRRRAVANDPAAKASAPPAPDPTHIPSGGEGGYTGLEAVANYIFWQTLSINRFDSIGHALMIAPFVNECSAYQTGPIDDSNRGLFERCNQWLGPYQPGVNAPDPTEGGVAATARARARDREPGRRPRGRLQPGEPEAPALPGRPDISTPQVTLPPQLQELLDRLPELPRTGAPDVNDLVEGAPGNRGGGQPSPDQLLDFLLGP
jgi:virulence factor Mce-like protein